MKYTSRNSGVAAALLSGALLGASQLLPGFSPISLLSLVPLLWWLERSAARHGGRTVTGIVGLFALGSQLIGVGWAFDFGVVRALGILSVNALLFTVFLLPFSLSFRGKRQPGGGWRYLVLALGWLSFELFHQQVPFGIPVNAPGVALAEYPVLVQWYAWTGAAGGTAWIVLVNVLLTRLALGGSVSRTRWAFALFPLAVSGVLLWLPAAGNGTTVRVAALHPDQDCRTTRKALSAPKAAELAVSGLSTIDEEVELILLPENYLADGGWVATLDDGPEQDAATAPLHDFIRRYPEATLLTGAIVYDEVPRSDRHSPLANFSEAIQDFFYVYSAVVALTAGGQRVVRTKQKLVPFEESLPYVATAGKWLDGLYRSLSGGGYYMTSRADRGPVTRLAATSVMSAICYEMAFSHHLAGLLRDNPAGLLTAHLNEGWYDSALGAHFFQRNARCRAIELRRAVARSSNRGITDMIDPSGRLLAENGSKGTGAAVVTADLPVVRGSSVFVLIGSRLWQWLLYPLFGFASLYLYQKN